MTDIYKSAEKHNLPKDEAYTYDMLASDILHLKELYPDTPVFSIGKSAEDRDILCLKLGTGSRRIFLCGAHHGMEWLTAKVCIEFAMEYLGGGAAGGNPSTADAGCNPSVGYRRHLPYLAGEAYVRRLTRDVTPPSAIADTSPTLQGRLIAEADAVSSPLSAPDGNVNKSVFDGREVSIYIVPMVNPDGVEIAASGYRWQANARGVDLNHNYDALWAVSRNTEKRFGIFAPCASKFGGEYPESEPESRAVADFTRQNNFDAVFALHSQGKVIYYDFCGIIPDGTLDCLERFESVSDYVRESPAGTAVYGGFKDWFIKKYKRPGFTIEIGLGENPLPLSQFDEVYSGVRGILWEMGC